MSDNKSIIRVQKNKDNPYVMINTGVFNESRLSWKSKGILGYLLSKPDHWQVRVLDLVKKSTDGETAVYSALKELKKFGYLYKYPVYEKGKIHHWESVVFETPQEKSYNGKNLLLENPQEGENTENQKNETEKLLLLENLEIEKLNQENRERSNNRTKVNIDSKKKTTTVKVEPEVKKVVVVSPSATVSPDRVKELQKEIKGIINSSISVRAIESMIAKKGEDQIYLYLQNWDKFQYQDIKNVSRFFETAVCNGYDIPEIQKATKGHCNGVDQANNYEQRKYDDEFYKSLYANV